MANTRSGGANNEGGGDASARKGSATAKSAATSTSSAGGRESRSSSTRETSDEHKPNLRRSNRETKGKSPIASSSASTPVSQKSTRGRSNPSTPDTPKSSPKKLKESTMKAGTPRTSDRIKKSVVSASTTLNDSNGVPSPVATPDKTVNGQIDEHNSTKHKHDASESVTRSLKKQKRLTAKSYTSLFKTSSEEYEKSPGYEGNGSKVHAGDNGSVLMYEESGAHEEDNKARLSQVVNNCLEGYTSGQCEAPEGILETDGSKTDVEKSAPISEAHVTADLCSENIVAESSLAMDAREPTDDCPEFALHVAMRRKADSSKFVEYWVPACLSRVQLEMYCYTLLSNSPALRSHSKTDSVGALRNILVSLRKCCDHPYLVDATLQTSLTKDHPVTDILDIGVRASGKLLLLDKMLQEIKGKGQRVLILTQSSGGSGNPMGDILDDFVRQRYGFESYERVERGLAVPKRQGAMSMFNDTTKGRFIFLIDSRACLPSIKLSSVDVIIIYCSDWNPTNDLRVLQRISIESQSECVPIFRLYSSCTLEEKALILAKHDHILDSNGKNITPILSHSLLSWGASFQFSRLEGLKNDAYLSKDSDAEKLFMDKVLQEYLTKLSKKDDPSTKMSNAAISQAHLNGHFYSRDSVVVGERDGISAPESDLPKFWVNLLDRKSPRWQYITEPAQRSRRKIQNMEEGKIPADEASTKRRKISGTLDSSENVLAGEDKDSILPEINTTSSSHQISVDHTWQEQGVGNLQDTQKGLHTKLKPELSKLYELFELPGSVKCLCEELLDYTLKNHQVSVEPKHILHAFNIALCWRAASLSRHQVNHRESLALAEEHLNYECSETLAELVYKKLRILKKEFSHRVGGTGENNQSISVKTTSPYQQETSTKYGNDKSTPQKEASVGGNESHQEDSHDLVIEAIVPGEKELLSVPEIHEKQHLSKDVLLNRIKEKRINLVDMVFSLREKNIHDKQANEVAMFDMHRHKGVVKLREACRIVVDHLRRSQADQEDRGGQTKLIVLWFTMLLCAFLKHMRYQREKLDWQQSKVWTKELQLKEDFLDKAKSGQLDHTFDQRICLPDSGFAIEEFSHFSSCVDTATLANCPQSLHETSAMEVTLVRSVIPSDIINADAARNGSAEVLIHSEGRLASEGIGLAENMISNGFGCIDSQGGASLSVQHQLNSSSATDNSINQESSSGDHRRTEHVEQLSGVGSQPLPGETDQCLGDVEMEVNNGNGDYTQGDPPESQTVAPVPSQVSLQMSKEVEAEANLVILSAEPIVAPVQLLQRDAEQVDRSGITPAAQTSQPEMQPSASREVSTPTDLIIQSAQPSMAPTVLSQRDVGQSSILSGVPSSQCLPSVPLSSIPLERTSPDQCQPSHQPEAAPGSSAQLFLGASMMFNHPPVSDEPLKNELHRLRLYIDSLNKTHELKQSQLRTECSQEIQKVKQKYDSLLQEHDSIHLQQRKTLDKLCEKVVLNQSLADDYRAKFVSSSAAQARARSPPNNQRPQPSQQVPTRPSAVASTASQTASLTAGRPTVPIHHVQPLQVDQPSPSSSPSSQVAGETIVRSTSPIFSLTQVLPRGRFGVQSEPARAAAPHLQQRLPPQVHSMASANQQQLPTRVESMSARTWSTPVTPVNIRQSCQQTVPPGNPSPSSLHPSSHPSIPAPLGPSSSHQIQQVPPLPSSSQPTPLPSPVSSIPNPVLALTSPRGLTTTSNVASAVPNVLPSRGVGPSASGMPPSDSDSASLDEWLTGKLGLPNDTPGVAARVDVVCLSDDEETDD
ncbi:Chromodomain-helicase-DNA-binding protein 3 [Hordeum vulgare]|nr:Chromodomain-helicase-DNA-binding protein 3 [Hordeum vulgare]